MAKATPEQARAGMNAWMDWAGNNSRALVDLGSPLDGATKVTPESTGFSKGTVTGYSIFQAQSLDALVKSLKNHPHFLMKGNSIEVFEVLPMPGM